MPPKRPPVPVAVAAAPTTRRDSVARREDSTRAALRNRRASEVWFRVQETAFDWGLNRVPSGPKPP